MANISRIKLDETTYDIRDARGSRVYYGTCSTAAATMPKVCQVEEFPTENGLPLVGTEIVVKYAATNSSTGTPLLNVNNTGTASVWYNNAAITGTKSTYLGYKNRYIRYMWDGTYWVFMGYSYDANSTYANYSLGNGYGVQTDNGSTAAITVAFTSYTLADNGRVSVLFRHDVPADATMNINDKGAKPIYIDSENPVTNAMKITAGVIKEGDIATFVYKTIEYEASGTDSNTLNRYVLVNINHDHTKQDIISDLATIRSGAEAGATAYQKPANGIPASDIASGVIPDVSGFATTSAMNTALNGKVDKETGKSLMTDAERTKLSGIASGAEVNVQSNWNETNSSSDAYIQNKPTNVSSFTNDAGYLTSESDPTVPSWAKAENKPTYTANEISGLATVATSGSYNDLSNKPTIPAAYDDTTLSGRVTALENAGFLTAETDPKGISNITTQQDGTLVITLGNGNTYTIDLNHTHPDKQNTLIAGTGITISGNTISATGTSITIDSSITNANQTNPVQGGAIYTALSNKVDKVSGKGLSTNDYTTAEKTKLSGIATGAEVNVQANWNESDSSSDAYIQNKPTIPTTASDINADVFKVNISSSGNSLSADKTFSQIYSAVQNGRTVVAIEGGVNVYQLQYCESGASVTFTNASGEFIETIEINSEDEVNYYSSTIPSDVEKFIVNIESDGNDGYTCDKTNAEIYSAWQNGREVVGIVDEEFIYHISYAKSQAAVFEGGNYDEFGGYCMYLIYTNNNNQRIIKSYKYFLDDTYPCAEITSSDITAWSNKQDALVSGTNIKTVNNQSLLGSGDLQTIVYGQKTQTGFRSGTYSNGNWIYSQSDITLLKGIVYYDVTSAKAYTYDGQSLKGFYYTDESLFAYDADISEVGYSGDYDDLLNKPTIPTVPTNVSSFTNDAGYLTAHQDISGKADVVTKVTNTSSGTASLALDSGKFYEFSNALTSLTITALNAPSSGMGIYGGSFTANSSGCTLSVPNTVTVASSVPTIEGGESYEFNIMNNVLLMIKL